MLKLIISLLVLGGAFSAAYAESGKFQTLDWDNSKEKLIYHSCGCADACWVADLRDKASNTSKIRLSCDCEKLHLKIGKAETVYQENCRAFENMDKFQHIVDTIQAIKSEKEIGKIR